MKILIVLVLVLFASPAFAAEVGIGGFFTAVVEFFNDIWLFFTDTVPSKIQQFFVWVVTYLVYLKFYFIKSSIEFSYAVAIGFLNMVNISVVVQSAVDALPLDLQQVTADIRFFDGLTLIIEALVTRFIYESF